MPRESGTTILCFSLRTCTAIDLRKELGILRPTFPQPYINFLGVYLYCLARDKAAILLPVGLPQATFCHSSNLESRAVYSHHLLIFNATSKEIMATTDFLNAQFDDSEDEDDFNPQPADPSDDEDAAASSQHDDEDTRNQRRANRDDVSEDGDEDDRRGKAAKVNRNEDVEEEEDAEGEEDGEEEDGNGGDEDEEEEEEDEEDEEITVCIFPNAPCAITSKIAANEGMILTLERRAIEESADANAETSSLMLKPKSMKMRMRTKMMRMNSTK